MSRTALALALAASVVTGVDLAPPGAGIAVAGPPAGFAEQVVFAGLDQPTNIEFAPDGRIFVAEKAGIVMVYDSLADATGSVFADLRTQVASEWDRGLLALALAPNFPADPSVYVLYTYDAPPGQTAPVWNDACADASGGQCVVTARLSRLTASGDHMTGTETVLIRDWCQQFPSHSIGDLHFGPGGALYVSAGDGANYTNADFGQAGQPINPCGDPGNVTMSPPSTEGGSLRSQDVRTTADPTGLDGAILRLDPQTGKAMAGNPMVTSADLNTRRIVAYGLRNPFRFAIRPGTSEIWIGDVGWGTWEEIDRVTSPTASVQNFGWPCFEGTPRLPAFDNADVSICENLYAAGSQTAPYFSYSHGAQVVAGESCPTGSSSPTGLAFYPTSGGSYPAHYAGALFFADYSRRCIWAMTPSTAAGVPDPSRVETFSTGAAAPVDLAIGPDGELYYVDIAGGTVRRIRYYGGNTPPAAVVSATPTGGAAPLTVAFDGTGSTDADAADQGRLTYSWDFGDGSPLDTSPTPMHIYAAGSFTARLTVTDTLGAQGTATVAITPGNDRPTGVIDTPAAATTWTVGQTVSFSGHATDIQDGTLPASALSWHLRLQHCSAPTTCHTHFLRDWVGVANGSFVAPDHDYPSYLELELVAQDSSGLTQTTMRRLDPLTTSLSILSDPPGLTLTVGEFSAPAPFTRTVIQGSSVTVSATPAQALAGLGYAFTRWSDGGQPTHAVAVPASGVTLTARYEATLTVRNVALFRPATADSSCRVDEGPAQAVNGSWAGGLTDKWCSKGASRWLKVDLGAVFSIQQFVVRHAGAGGEGTASLNTRDFTIQVSDDGVAWRTVVTVTGNTSSVTTHPVTTTGRYVRLNVQVPTSSGDLAARIYEFEIYGALPVRNVALFRPATADSSCRVDEGPAQAVNGSWAGGLTDKWCSKGASRWLKVDLGAVFSIQQFVVRHAGAGGEGTASLNTRDFTIQVSDDGVAWRTVVTVTGNTSSVTTHPVTTTGRYVRLNVQVPTSSGDLAARIYEFEIYGA